MKYINFYGGIALEIKDLKQAIGELEEEKVLKMLKKFVASNPTEEEAKRVVSVCQEGMDIVGDLFEKGKYFIGDLIFAGELLTEVIDELKAVLNNGHNNKLGTIVLGTVQGDLHDIGKNIFRSMAETAGFEVYDIGRDQSVSTFINTIKEVEPDIVGMSGALTQAMETMKNIVDGLKETGYRDNVKVIIGGNVITKDLCEYIGADVFTTNAAVGVKICKNLVE